MIKTVGIIGAGKLGVVLAQLALKAGYEVLISASGNPDKIRLTVETLAPGAVATTSEDIAEKSDVVILALPLGKFRQLSKQILAGKLVVDATNYWWEVDGPRDEILPDSRSSSQAVQEFFTDSIVVKALSHMSYHDLHDSPKPRGESGRKAIAVAGDNQEATNTVSRLVDSLGFEPVLIGDLENGRNLEPGTPAFGANVGADELRRLVG